MNRRVVLRIALIVVLMALLFVFAKTEMDFVYTGF